MCIVVSTSTYISHFAGFIELAADADRLEEYRRISAINRKHGVDVHEISPQEVQKLFPLCRKSHANLVYTRQLKFFLQSCIFLSTGVDDIQAGFYVKEDGRVNPVDVTMALAKGTVLTQTVAPSNNHSSCEPY